MNVDLIKKWAERLIRIKDKFQESWINISDQVALEVLGLLESREIEFDQVFNRMLEFAVQLYLLKMEAVCSLDVNLSEILHNPINQNLVEVLKSSEITTLNDLKDFLLSGNKILTLPGFWRKSLWILIKNLEPIEWFPAQALDILKKL